MRGVFNNLFWKLASLAMAVLLWLIFVGDPEMMTSMSVPIQYKNLPLDLEITSELPERVHLEIRGPSGRLSSALESRIAVLLDMSAQPTPGERTFTIRQRDLNLPNGIQLARAVPAQLRIRFERRIEKVVPVQVRYAGPPPAGYRVVHQEVFPDKRTIVGPESRINRIEFVETDQIDLSSLVSEAEFHVYCFTDDPLVGFNETQTVSVRVQLEKIPTEKPGAKATVRD